MPKNKIEKSSFIYAMKIWANELYIQLYESVKWHNSNG